MVRIILRTLAVAGVLGVLAVFALFSFKSPYLRFLDRDQNYYAEVAHACDLILQQHPLGTNATIIPISGTSETFAFVHVPGSDPSLPKVIRDLHPSKITISSNRVHVIAGVRDFGISWEPQEGGTNSWALNVYPEGPQSVVYVESRP